MRDMTPFEKVMMFPATSLTARTVWKAPVIGVVAAASENIVLGVRYTTSSKVAVVAASARIAVTEAEVAEMAIVLAFGDPLAPASVSVTV